MHSKKECLQLIKAVQDVADDPESAYLLRTRLKRVLLSVSRLAAYHSGIKQPELPGMMPLPTEATHRSHKLIDTCNHLFAKTRKLCQPSEALDTRWNYGWVSVLRDLKILEQQLIEWPESH
jgi:hypothetical protein